MTTCRWKCYSWWTYWNSKRGPHASSLDARLDKYQRRTER